MMKKNPFLKLLLVPGLLMVTIFSACVPTNNPASPLIFESLQTNTPLPAKTAQPTEIPSPTGTPDPIAAFAEPILIAIQDRPPDFQDDFSSDSNGWIIKTWPQDRSNEVISNGVMNLVLEQGGIADNHATSFRDFVMQVDVKFLDLNSENGLGLEWLRYEVFDDTMKVQRLTITSTNWWGLRSCSPMEPPECQEGPSGTADVDPSEPITIMLISKGTELAVYLNGMPLAYENYLGLPPASHIRFIGMNDLDNPNQLGTEVDNFKIWELQAVFPPNPPDPALGVGSSWERLEDGMVMMYVPEGEFLMGSNFGEPNEQPVHAVYLDAFWIDQTEVTNAMYAKFLTEMGNQKVAFFENLPPDIREMNVTWLKPDGAQVYQVQGGSTWQPLKKYADFPVINVNWFGAEAYCAWAGGRLPTEAEWEKAARGGLEGKLYPWGDEEPTCKLGAVNGAWLGPACGPPPASMPPVGSYAPNGYGLYDMVASVTEWVADIVIDYKGPNRQDYTNSPYRNPLGPISGIDRIRAQRGDPILISYMSAEIASRNDSMARGWNIYTGFRCVRAP